MKKKQVTFLGIIVVVAVVLIASVAVVMMSNNDEGSNSNNDGTNGDGTGNGDGNDENGDNSQLTGNWIDLSSNIEVEENPAGTKPAFTDVHVIGDEVWISDGNSYYPYVYYSADGGATFTIQENTLGTDLYSIYMKNPNEGYCGGIGGYLYKYNPTAMPTWEYHGEVTGQTLTSLTFAGDTGHLCCFNGYVADFISSNMGTTTKLVNSDLKSITFPVENEGWVCGSSIIRHYNGTEWVADQNYNLDGSVVSSIYFVDTNNGWAVGSNGLILHTTDGKNWAAQNSHFQYQFNDVFFLNSNEGWVVGFLGAVRHTTDGGATWEIVDIGTSNDLGGVFFTSSDNGYIVGVNKTIFKFVGEE